MFSERLRLFLDTGFESGIAIAESVFEARERGFQFVSKSGGRGVVDSASRIASCDSPGPF